MKKTLILVGVSLAVLLAVMLIYRAETYTPLPTKISPKDIPRQATTQTGTLAGQNIGPGKDVFFDQVDRNGRRQGKYMAASWEPNGQEVNLTKPHMELYTRGGETIYVFADHGKVMTDESTRDMNSIRRGTLSGHVRIVIDQNTHPEQEKGPIEQRPDDLITVYVPQVDFDNDLLEISSKGDVTVYSRQANIFGQDLTITWNTGPDELRQLRLEKGNRMEIYEGQDQTLLALPGGDAPKETSVAGTKPAKGGKMPAATTRPAGPLPQLARLTATAPAKPIVEDIPQVYVVTLHDNVQVSSPQRYLHDAKQLELYFVYKTQKRNTASTNAGQGKKPTATQPAGKGRAATPASTRPARKSSNPFFLASSSKPAGEASSAPATQKSEPMVVTWDGPLTLTPVRANPPAIAEGDYDLRAFGDDVKMGDTSAKARCQQVEYLSLGREARLTGSAERPVELVTDRGERVVSRMIRFSADNGIAYLEGQGSMLLSSSSAVAAAAELGSTAAAPPASAATTESATTEPARSKNIHIAWTKDVEAQFVTVAPSAGKKGKQFLKNAVFRGDVNILQGDGSTMQADLLHVDFRPPVAGKGNQVDRVLASGKVKLMQGSNGDFIHSDRLAANMGVDAQGNPYPEVATAMGSVVARQENNQIATQWLKVTFEPGPASDKADDKLATGKSRFHATKLVAKGGVVITDTVAQREVKGQELVSDAVARTAVITGDPAVISEKSSRIQGNTIRFDQIHQKADVDGPGSLEFSAASDLSGNQTATPRPVKMVWKQQMEYRGLEDQATIIGDVVLDSQGDTVRGATMTIKFEPAAAAIAPALTSATPAAASVVPAMSPATQPAAPVAAAAKSDKLGGTAEMAKRHVKMFIVDGGAFVESRRNDADGRIDQRRTMTCPTITYTKSTSEFDAVGKGTLLVEDYRAPEPASAGRQNNDPTQIDRPAQTLFTFSKGMKFLQDAGTVEMTDDVYMVHSSGGKMEMKDRLPKEKWGNLPEGRHTTLHCALLLARFSKAPGPVKPDTDGPNFGRLELFNASGNEKTQCVLRDGTREADGQRIIYDRTMDMAIIFGDEEGQSKKPAVISNNDVANNAYQTQTGAKLVWYRQNNKIVVEKASMTGGK